MRDKVLAGLKGEEHTVQRWPGHDSDLRVSPSGTTFPIPSHGVPPTFALS